MNSGNVLLQGAVPEMFTPAIKRDEGCSEADWLRLSLDLWRETGEAKYIEQAERALISGDFGHYPLSAEGIPPPHARAWSCCMMHGLRAFAAVFEGVPGAGRQVVARPAGRQSPRPAPSPCAPNRPWIRMALSN
jgi:hypothetical protein